RASDESKIEEVSKVGCRLVQVVDVAAQREEPDEPEAVHRDALRTARTTPYRTRPRWRARRISRLPKAPSSMMRPPRASAPRPVGVAMLRNTAAQKGETAS